MASSHLDEALYGQGIGGVIYVCSNCGYVFKKYVIGDKRNKVKFGGVPTPERAVSEYDGFICPSCGRLLSRRPVKVQAMSLSTFNRIYKLELLAMGEYLVRRDTDAMAVVHLRASYDLSQGIPVAPGEAEAEEVL